MTPTNPYNSREFRLVVEALACCTQLLRALAFARAQQEPLRAIRLDLLHRRAQERWLRRQENLLNLWTTQPMEGESTMTYQTRNGRQGGYIYNNSRLETLIEALDDLVEHAPLAYSQRVAVIHQRLKDAHAGRRQPAELIAFLYAPWTEQE